MIFTIELITCHLMQFQFHNDVLTIDKTLSLLYAVKICFIVCKLSNAFISMIWKILPANGCIISSIYHLWIINFTLIFKTFKSTFFKWFIPDAWETAFSLPFAKYSSALYKLVLSHHYLIKKYRLNAFSFVNRLLAILSDQKYPSVLT